MSRAAIIAITRRIGPMTAKQLAWELGIAESSIRTSIRRARDHGTAHIRIAGWAMDVAKYGPGPEDDADGGSTSQLILARLDEAGPESVIALAEILKVSVEAIDSAIRRLRAKKGRSGLVITGWRLTRGKGGREGPIYGLGKGEDAPRPDFSNAQRQSERRYVAKRRVQRVLSGGTTRASRQVHSISAGIFDGLVRR